MSEMGNMFLRRIEEMWDQDKLHKFVSEQVNWMYEDLESPKDMKAAFLKDFHDEFVNIANAMAGPFEAYQKILMCDARPILHISGPVNLEDLMTPGKICKLPEGADARFVLDRNKVEEAMFLNWPKTDVEAVRSALCQMAEEEYEKQKQEQANRPAGGVDGHH